MRVVDAIDITSATDDKVRRGRMDHPVHGYGQGVLDTPLGRYDSRGMRWWQLFDLVVLCVYQVVVMNRPGHIRVRYLLVRRWACIHVLPWFGVLGVSHMAVSVVLGVLAVPRRGRFPEAPVGTVHPGFTVARGGEVPAHLPQRAPAGVPCAAAVTSNPRPPVISTVLCISGTRSLGLLLLRREDRLLVARRPRLLCVSRPSDVGEQGRQLVHGVDGRVGGGIKGL